MFDTWMKSRVEPFLWRAIDGPSAQTRTVQLPPPVSDKAPLPRPTNHRVPAARVFRAVGLDLDGGMIAGLQLMFPVFLPLIHGRNHESKHGH